MTMRRVALALLVVALAVGLWLRFGPRAAAPEREARLSLSHKEARVIGRVGPFIVDGVGDRERQSLRLRHEACAGPVFVSAAHIFGATAERLIAFHYPGAAWRTFYVYHGRVSENFARFPALVRFIAGRVRAQLTLSRLDPSEMVFFTFHAPADCALDEKDLVAASNALLGLATAQRW
jgi:hypothetical protein